MWFRDFPFYVKIEDYIICHAGVQRGLTLKEASDFADSEDDDELLNSIIWNRKPSFLKDHFIIHGHSPVKDIKKTAHYVNIDTGCVYGGKLTMMLLPEMEFISVDLIDEVVRRQRR
jgi:hypothetical protein